MGVGESAERSYFLIIGPSGAGLTSALNAFGDFGFTVVGDIPPEKLISVYEAMTACHHRVAFALKHSSQGEAPEAMLEAQMDSLLEALKAKQQDADAPLKILYLDAPESTLIQRYLKSEKKHPLENKGLQQGIATEKLLYKRLYPLKNYSIDTQITSLTEFPHKVAKILGIAIENNEFTIYLNSFGFKYGVPQDSELLFDMRFINNPFYDEKLRPLTGLDQPVKDYIFSFDYAETFLKQWAALLAFLVPHYQQQGKTRLTVSIGCTGGQHRSVCMTESLAAEILQAQTGCKVVVLHREMAKWPKKPSSSAGDLTVVAGEAK